MSNINTKLSEKIAKLFERADHPNTSEHEAAACREKAEKLMRENRISEAMLHLTDEQKRVFEQYIVPTNWGVVSYGARLDVAVTAFEHAGCKVKSIYGGKEMLHVVGYPTDVFYGKVLFERAIEELNEVLDPQWKDNMSEDQNIYRFKNSGRTWAEVRDLFALHSGKDFTIQGVQYRYKKWCKHIGAQEVPQTRRHEAYRRSVESAFTVTLFRRLYDLKVSTSQEDEPGEYAVALIKDEDALLEEFYNLFPEMRPETPAEREARRAKSAAERAEAERLEEARRAALTDRQREAEDRKAQRAKERAEKAYRAYRDRNREDLSGWAAGDRAAQRVRLSLNDEMSHTKHSLNV